MPVLGTSNVKNRENTDRTDRKTASKYAFKILTDTNEYIKLAFIASLIISPLNLNALPDSYFPPIVYLFLVSLVNTIIFILSITFEKPLKDNITVILKAFFVILITSFILYCLFCLIYSFFSSRIIGQAHTAKQFGLHASSYTYLPVVLVLMLVCPYWTIAWLGSFGIVLLMSYYIESTYFSHYSYTSKRTERFHHIFIFLMYYGIALTCEEIPERVFLQMLYNLNK
ncbi:uncharacterized protein VICG_01986 [Vittaforma corneae ATCC 50505]|uniref:Uncharacterized protein n=1 Tax=Vittaforma corneae (strain ATCC 50505) TaxID=993615 RepID=L2GJB4_VITCO|nr:uncharacterized protein VICG_01986 [Vittaforma corneae ATCC 50505]ELA40956.1 hypothetical protein VICG_01986 [Vittaforma corneae ATCC 50505]